MAVDSLRRRYGYKFAASCCSLVTNVVGQTLVIRGLGPQAYGDFSFLTQVAQLAVNFVESVSAMFFSTRLAQKPGDASLVRLNLGLYALCCGAGLGAAWIADIIGLFPAIFPGQERRYVYMAVCFVLLLWLPQVLNRMTDAYGLTVASEIARILQRTLGVVVLAALVLAGGLNLWSVFLYNYAISATLAAAFWRILRRDACRPSPTTLPAAEKMGSHVRDFWQYSKPIFLLSLSATVAGFADRWILQRFGRSSEQAYFGIASQIASVSFLFTGAMVPLLTREFSILHGERDWRGLARAFTRFLPMFYALTAMFSCFAAVHCVELVALLGGTEYQEAVPAVAIMALYPVHQTLGQMSSALFFATGETRLYSVIGITFQIVGIPAAYYIMAQGAAHGPGNSASALALKMVLMQFVAVNVLLFYNAKRLKLHFTSFFCHETLIIIMFLSLGAGARSLSSALLGNAKSAIFVIATSGLTYFAACLLLIRLKPGLFGCTSAELGTGYQLLKKLLVIRCAR